ncbi:polycystin family receptor for egg jelly-like [Mytilus californianus]|uniref:polycystin family receptor for egg jelly-like n=1 Tax=Mytilus californianus TaxID=6549 RepID=UPI002247DA86|nr:polycystin family receptor for egg jelly-like [Mytilus californianus]
MALKEPSGRIAILTATGKNYEFFYDVNSETAWGIRLTSGYNLTTTPSTFTSQHALKTFIEKPSRIKFRHTFLGTDEFYNVTATVQNDVTNPSRQAVALVEQLILISDVHIELPYAAETTTVSDNTTLPGCPVDQYNFCMLTVPPAGPTATSIIATTMAQDFFSIPIRYADNYLSAGPIPDGLPENSYMVEIIARAYDQVGAFADIITSIRVDPANQQDVTNILVNATSETGIVNNLFVGADIKIAPVAKVLGKFLNEEADSAPSDQEIIATTMATNMSEADRLAMEQQLIAERGEAKVRRTETRAAMLDGFKRIKAPSLEAVQNTAAALSELTKKQDELSETAQGKEIYTKVEAQTDNLIKTISAYKVVGEKDAILESPKLNITLRKRLTIDMNDKPLLEVGGFSSLLMPKSQSIFGDTGNETTFFVATEALRMTNNPFTWTDTTAGSAQKISSDVVSLRYRNDSGLEVPVQDNSQMFDIFVDRTNFDTSVNIVRNVTRAWDQSMVIHSVDIENTGSLHIKLEQILNITDMIDYIEEMFANIANNTNDTQTEFALELKPVEWYVFVKANEPPTTTDYDFNCTLPLSDDALAEMLSYIDAMKYENDTTADRSSYIHEQPDSYTCFFTNNFLSINETTKFYIGIKHLVMNMSEDHPLYWHYYSTEPPTTTPPTTTPKIYTTTCTTFSGDYDKGDIKDWLNSFEKEKRWGGNGGGGGGGGGGDGGGGDGGGGGGGTKIVCTTYPNTKTPKVKKPKTTKPPPEPAYKQAVYRLSIFSAYCIWWDRMVDQWSNEGCEVGPLSSPDRIHCLSSHLTSFAAGFAVPMNTIDLNDSAFTKLDENPIIFCTMVSLMCLYMLMCIWARKRDLMDKIMAGSSPLPDNDPRDKYLYEIQVFTGSRKGAGTTAKVSFILTGEKEETSPRFLADEKRPVLQSSNIDGFVMAVPKPLGKLTHLRIWHDNMGSNPPWYFSRMQIEDLMTGDKYFFVCENWLSLDDDDGLIDRMIPVAGRAELTSFNYLFWTKTKYSLADGHLWFSIFKRPAKSNFTRIQRLTCCLSLLFATMCTSIAFYKSDEGSNPKEYGVGPVTITPTGLYIGIVSGLICLPINLLIVALFRYSKPFPKKVEETLAYRFYSKFLCFACVQKKVHGMDEKQEEEENNDMVENAKKARAREKSDLDADAVKVELENELEMLEKGESFDDGEDNGKNNSDRSVHPPPDKDMKKPSAELNPIPRALTLKKDDKKKKPFRLPYWGIYIGYVISFCTVAVAFWATVEFGGVFGPKKSLEWLVSFFISCFESIFFSQPIKVIIIAVIYAVFIKKPEANDDDNDKQLEPGEEWLHSHMTEEDLKNPDKRKELEKMKTSAPLPPELDFLKTAREERAHEMAMYSLLKEIAICVFFLYFVLMIAYTNRDPWSYNQYTTYNNMFNLGSFSPSYTVQFDQVNSIAQFWNWTQNALLNSLYYTDWYNGDVFSDSSSLIQDKQTLLVGSARLRQLRTIPYKCVAPLDYLIEYCRDDYSSFSEDKKDYKLNWDSLNGSDPTDIPDSLFSYSKSSDIDGYPYWGIFSTYGGGGYVADLGTTMTDASTVIDTLMKNNWVDNNTRAIFIEVNLYNPNNNLFGICLYVLEFLQTGGIEPFERFFIFRLDRYSNGFMYFVMAIELITMAFVIFYTVTEVKKIRKLKTEYFKEFWNVWELIVLAIAYGLVLVFIYRSVISVQMMKKVKENPTTFVNFFFAIVWDECCGYFIGILAFMETLRFLRLLRFNKKVSLFTSTMMYVAKPLLSFGVVFMSGFLAFSTTAYFFFNTYMFDFRTFVSTLETLLSMMLGKFDYEKAWTTTRVAGPIIFGMFALCFNFILVNFFLTIVIDGFEVVKSDLSKQSNDYEVVDHMMKKVKMLLGIDVPRKRKTGYSMDPRLNIYTYIEGKTPDQELCDELDGKVQNMIERCNTLAEFPEDEDLEKEIQELKTKKKRKIVVGQ